MSKASIERFLAKRREEILNGNRAFMRAGKKAKRLMIARDVLAALKAGRLVAESGTYFRGGTATEFVGDGADLQAALLNEPQCVVCGIGAAFVCAAERFDKAKVEALDDGRAMRNVLKRYFSHEQVYDIENAFEEDRIVGGSWAAADHFDGTGCGDRDRLRCIFENIIANDGTFRYDIKPVKVRGVWHAAGWRAAMAFAE